MGKKWLVTLAFRTGVPPEVRFSLVEAEGVWFAPHSTADDLRLALKTESRVWAKPQSGKPGFWV